MHLLPFVPSHIVKLDGNAASWIDANHAPFSLHSAVINGEDQFEFGSWGHDRAGFYETPSQADVDQISEYRAIPILRPKFDGHPALHPWIRSAVFARGLLLLFDVHAAISFSQQRFCVFSIAGVDRLAHAERKNVFAANFRACLPG